MQSCKQWRTKALTFVAAYVCRSSLLVMSCTVECQMSLVENSPARSMRVIMTSVYHSRSGKNLSGKRTQALARNSNYSAGALCTGAVLHDCHDKECAQMETVVPLEAGANQPNFDAYCNTITYTHMQTHICRKAYCEAVDSTAALV